MNKEKLQVGAMIAEVIGGFAIVISLIFLILKTQDNTTAIKAQTYQALTDEMNQTRRQYAEPGNADLIMKGRFEGYDDFSPSETFRLMNLILTKWAVYESSYFSRIKGVLDEEEWTRFEKSMCRESVQDKVMWSSVGNKQIFSTGVSDYLTDEFVVFVEVKCGFSP